MEDVFGFELTSFVRTAKQVQRGLAQREQDHEPLTIVASRS